MDTNANQKSAREWVESNEEPLVNSGENLEQMKEKVVAILEKYDISLAECQTMQAFFSRSATEKSSKLTPKDERALDEEKTKQWITEAVWKGMDMRKDIVCKTIKQLEYALSRFHRKLNNRPVGSEKTWPSVH